MTKIKICGITNTEDARFAALQGADYIGFIFYPPSARYVEPRLASEIVLQIHKDLGLNSPQFVGVFVDASVNDVRMIREQVGLDLVQLHGEETPEELSNLSPGAYKALRPVCKKEVKALAAVYGAVMPVDNLSPQLLVDAYHPTEKGGTGQRADLDIAIWLSQRYRLLLAGGLNPTNVTAAMKTVQPWGVDVSSGVEIIRNGKQVKGCKDHDKVQAFINAVRTVTS